jgi:hypothetical protein
MKLHKHYNNTNYGLYSTKNRCTVVWNMLPGYIKNSDSKYIFKCNLMGVDY